MSVNNIIPYGYIITYMNKHPGEYENTQCIVTRVVQLLIM